MMAAELANTAGSATLRIRLARAGVRCSGCHGLDRVRVHVVMTAMSRARQKAKSVKSMVLPA
jgi:hypothetical protein